MKGLYKGGIYKITTPKNEVYIGCTDNVYQRVKSHAYRSHNKLLRKSMKDHGYEAHKFEFIATDKDNLKRSAIERMMILKYYLKGYNILNKCITKHHHIYERKICKIIYKEFTKTDTEEFKENNLIPLPYKKEYNMRNNKKYEL